MVRWTNANLEKLGRGILSADGRYFITADGFRTGSKLSWVFYDFTDNSRLEGFWYQRDAKAYAEELQLR
jgi:hypothetical protein